MTDNSKDTNQLPISPDEFARAFDSADQSVESLHSRLASGIQYAGYIREALKVIRRIYAMLASRSVEEPELISLVQTAIEFVRALTSKLNEIEKKASPPMDELYALSASAFSFTAATGVIPIPNNIFLDPSQFTAPAFISRDRDIYAARMGKLSPTLGNTYKGAWESFFGRQSEALRSALFLMRQTFDHLFAYLSPDDEVRASKFWHAKSEGDPQRIYRAERITYAAYTHVKDQAQASTLAASAKQMLEVYDSLNKAHQRSELDDQKATIALNAMSSMLEDWIDAISIT